MKQDVGKFLVTYTICRRICLSVYLYLEIQATVMLYKHDHIEP